MKKDFLTLHLAMLLMLGARPQQTITLGGGKSGVDTLVLKKGQKVKEIFMEISTSGNPHILIDNSNRDFEIRPWDENKISVTTAVTYDSTSTEAELWKRANIDVSENANLIKIKSGFADIGNQRTIITSGKTVTLTGTPSAGAWPADHPDRRSERRTLIIRLPKHARLEIENKFANIYLSGDLADLDLEINNGRVIGMNVDTLILRSKYSFCQFRDSKIIHATLDYGRLLTKDVGYLNIFSNYTTAEFGNVTKAVLEHSNNDSYEMEKVGDIKCKKDYGDLRIENLTGHLEFEGTNSDIKLRNIDPSVELISINNQFADLRLPIKGLRAFVVDFNGKYSTVLADFNKMPMMDSTGRPVTSNSRFFSRAGDDKDKPAQFRINCASCRVDFN